jgi:Flp pilus assembly pilin Flp
MSRPVQESWAKLPARESEFGTIKTHLLAGFALITIHSESADDLRMLKLLIGTISGIYRYTCISELVSRPQGEKGVSMSNLLNIVRSDEGQDIAEYAVMLAVILVIVVGTIRLIGSNANNVFSNTASSIQ